MAQQSMSLRGKSLAYVGTAFWITLALIGVFAILQAGSWISIAIENGLSGQQTQEESARVRVDPAHLIEQATLDLPSEQVTHTGKLNWGDQPTWVSTWLEQDYGCQGVEHIQVSEAEALSIETITGNPFRPALRNVGCSGTRPLP